MLNGMVRGVVLLGMLPVLLAGCASPTLEERAHELLQERVDGAHLNVLDIRAHHPESTGESLLRSLDPWGYAFDSSVTDDGVTLLLGVGASVTEREGWIEPSETTVSVGACVLVVVRERGGEGDRGTVRTEPVRCPTGAEVLENEGPPVESLTTDLEGRMDDVPEPPYDPPVCYSGGDCSEGGG